MNETHRPPAKKSTNVRVSKLQLAIVRGTFRFLERVAPSLAIAFAVRLFRTVRPFRRPGREARWLQGARREDIELRNPFENREQTLAVWTWEPPPAARPGGAGERSGAARPPAPTVLLVHGWEGRGSQLGALVEPLLARGYRVVAFDAVGHGESSGKLSSLPEFAAGVRRVAEHALGGRDEALAAAVGHSFGTAALSWALAAGEVRTNRLVFLSPPSDLEFYIDQMASLLGFSPWVRQGMISSIQERFRVIWDDARFATLRAARPTPLLLVHDEDDRETTVADSETLLRSWPDARLLVTQGLGHRRILRDGDVVEEVVEFVEGRLPRVAATGR